MGRQINFVVAPDDPLLNCWLKIYRAKKHFNDLNAEVEAFKAKNPYRIVLDEDSEPAIKIYKLQIVEQIPVTWSCYVGDIVHNLRSALDALAMALVERSGITLSEDVMQKTYFPIHWTKGQLSSENTKLFFERVGPNAEKFIRRLQPYRGGKGDALWRLHRLDLIDKHRAIIPVGSTLPKIQIHFPTPPIEGVDPASMPVLPPVEFGVAQRRYPLKDGDELFRSAFHQPEFEAKATNFVFEIAFGEGQVVDGEPMMPTLSQGINFVGRLLIIFGKRFFR